MHAQLADNSVHENLLFFKGGLSDMTALIDH